MCYKFPRFGSFIPGAFLLCMLFIGHYNLPAQTLDFENYTTSNGLITDEVYNMHQDKQGYLWVFSNEGTVKYTGTRFKSVLKNLSFDDSFIYTMYEREDGRKWIANSNAKIFEVKNDSAFLIKGIEKVTEKLKRQVSEIFKLYVDKNSDIFVITKGHSYKLENRKGYYLPVNLSTTMEADSIIYKVIDTGEDVLAISNRKMMDGIPYIDRLKKKTYIEVNAFHKEKYAILSPLYYLDVINHSCHLRNLKKYSSDDYYFLFSNSLAIIKDEKLSFIKFKSIPLNFTRDNEGNFWVCCLNDGIYQVNANGHILHHYLGNTTVNDILVDHQNGLWATTPGLGVFHCENIRNKIFSKDEPLGTSICFSEIIEDTLYIGNIKGEIVSVFKGGTKLVRSADNLETKDLILHDRKLMLSNISGTKQLYGKNDNAISSYLLKPAFLKTISLNNEEIVGCTRQCIVYSKANKIKKIFYHYNKINTIEAYAGELWIATSQGVYRTPVGYEEESAVVNGVVVYDTLRLDQTKILKPTLNANITRIVKDKKNDLWLCSKGSGLFLLANNVLQKFTRESGLPDNVTNDLFFNEDDKILLSTNSGLYVADVLSIKNNIQDWKKIFTGSVQNCVQFGNDIYIGTKRGLVIIKKDTGNENEKNYFNLASVTIDSKEMNPLGFKGLTSDQKNLEFNFDYLNFYKEKPLLRYTLSGTDSSSGNIENLNFRVGQLLPGSYTLSIYPNTHAGQKFVKSIAFYVLPPMWQTTEFIVSSILLVIILIVLAVYFILRSRKKKEAIRLKNEQLLLEYKLVALKAQINPHFMSNCLSAIQDLILSNNTDKATFYVAQFGLLVRQILEYSSQPLITLQEELDLLKLYVELEQLRFEQQFTFTIEVEKDVLPKDTYVPPLILNPIVENAIWHGLLPLKGLRSGNLIVSVKSSGENLTFLIKDNGVGRDETRNTMSNNKTKSYGIKITEQRLKNINFLFKNSASMMQFADLKDADGKGCGTSVMILIPVNLDPYEIEQS